MKALNTLNIAFYHFVNLENLSDLRPLFKNQCAALEMRGSILLTPEGINGMLAGEESKVRQFMDWMRSPECAELCKVDWGKDLQFKESFSDSIPFTRLLVKIKNEVIPLGDPSIRPRERTGARLSPQELKRWYDEGKPFYIVDTRNQYEMGYGTFEKAEDLGLRHFRTFPEKLAEWSTNKDKKEMPLVMFCTGGVRCEKASVVAMDQGWEEVYQLDGGILKYFEECGGAHYQGECFVFDKRVALDSKLQKTVIGKFHIR